MPSAFLSPLILTFAVFSSSSSRHQGGCSWRFHDCFGNPQNSLCLVQLQEWCGCDHNASCPTNKSLEVNSTEASVHLGIVGKFCNITACTVVPKRCEWTPWQLYINMCVIRRWERIRHPCCHPVYRFTPVSATSDAPCIKNQKERQTKSNYDARLDCLRPPNTPPPSRTENESSEKSSWEVYQFALFGLLILLIIPIVGAAERCKRRRQRLSGRSGRSSPPIVINLRGPEEHPRPRNAITPQPGQPLCNTYLLS